MAEQATASPGDYLWCGNVAPWQVKTEGTGSPLCSIYCNLSSGHAGGHSCLIGQIRLQWPVDTPTLSEDAPR